VGGCNLGVNPLRFNLALNPGLPCGLLDLGVGISPASPQLHPDSFSRLYTKPYERPLTSAI
jgi:hypothetical protein